MNRCMRYAWCLGLLAVLFATPAQSQIRNQVFVGARPMGMGETFVGVADDANAIYWNPAGLPQLQRQELTFTYADLYGLGLRNLYGAYVYPVTDNSALGVDVFNTGFDDKELQFGQWKFNLGYGYRWRRLVSLGATFKYVLMNIGQDNRTLDNAGGIGFDAGLLITPGSRFRFGLMAQDVTNTSIKHDSGKSEAILKRNIRGGVSVRPIDPLLLAADVSDRLHFGAEYSIANMFALRGGLQRKIKTNSQSDFDGKLVYSGGVGVKYRLVEINYAYERHPFLPATQRFSISLMLNPSYVSIKDAVLRPKSIYRSLYPHYQQQEFADVVLKNASPDALPVTLILEIPSLLDQPYEEQVVLPPQSTTTQTMGIVFADSVLLTEASGFDRLVQPRVSVRYEQESASKTADRSVAPVYVLGRGKMSWDDPARMGAFVTPNDPAIAGFVQEVMGNFRQELYGDYGNSNIGKAALIYNAISTHGVLYQRDPQTPFLSVSGDRTIFDTIRYPYELLRDKVGDCDDCTVLFASMLENLDIQTALLDVDAPGAGHVYMMFDSGINEDRAEEFFQPNDYVAWEGKAWIPVETTLYGKGDFRTAWRNGVQEYYQRKSEGTVNEVDLHTAMLTTYPAGRIQSTAIAAPSSQQMSRGVQSDIQQYSTYVRQLVGEPQNTPLSLYDAGAHYLRIGRLREALDMMDRTLRLDPNFADAYNTKGVIYTRMGQYDRSSYDRALEQFNQALTHEPSNAGIRLNLAIVYILRGGEGDRQRALQEYGQAQRINPNLQDALRGIIDQP
ncbi:MAG: PorV/PorQ family protein [candidate division Zixibacteria bacterium]|nr:PorV/PorQ family protein [candidate division Zixibacteria bacterium]